jgi:hypothetical protein
MSIYRFIAGIAFVLVLPVGVFAQGSGQSPYSLIGLGELSSGDLMSNRFVGGMGVAWANTWRLNYKNPATLTQNIHTSFNIGVKSDIRTVSNNTTSLENGGADLDYIILGIPIISGRWNMGLGLQSFSNVNYSVESEQVIGEDSIQTFQTFRGEGGLSAASLAMGYRLLKGLNLGVRVSYLFGPINREGQITFGETSEIGSSISSRTTYSDFLFNFGLYYAKGFGKDRLLAIGATFEPGSDITANRTRQALEVDATTGNIVDTLIIDDGTKGIVDLPSRSRFGVSYGKLNKWRAGLEFTYQDWNQFSSFGEAEPRLTNSYILSVGGDFIPKYDAARGYFNRVTYMAGFRYEKTPYALNNQDVNEFGINFGLSLPMARVSSFEVGFEYGRRGSIEDNLIEEEFYKIYFGISFNDIQWKKRPIYN